MKTLLLLLLTLPVMAQVPQRGPVIAQHDCYTDSIYLIKGHKQGYFGWDTLYMETKNPFGLEYEFTVDYHMGNVVWGWEICVNEDGKVWCSDLHYAKWQQLGLYGYSEYHDEQLIYTGLDRDQMPKDFELFNIRPYGSDERMEDHLARIKFSSTAKSIKYGFISPIISYAWMHPKCFAWDRVTRPTTTDERVRYYDLMGREVIPQIPGIYIKVQGNESEKVWVGGYELQNLGR